MGSRTQLAAVSGNFVYYSVTKQKPRISRLFAAQTHLIGIPFSVIIYTMKHKRINIVLTIIGL